MNGIKFWSYNAGHVLGAAMFMVEIAGVKVLYTGDFSCEEDRHLMSAEIPSISPDVLISVRLPTLHPPSLFNFLCLTNLCLGKGINIWHSHPRAKGDERVTLH